MYGTVLVERQHKYSDAERTVDAAKASLSRIAELLPEHAEDVQLELIASLERFDEFLCPRAYPGMP